MENSQPVQRAAGAAGNRRELALAHNGNLINAVELHARLRAEGVSFASTSDSEIIAALIASHPQSGSRTPRLRSCRICWALSRRC